jgi:hypothetical protein
MATAAFPVSLTIVQRAAHQIARGCRRPALITSQAKTNPDESDMIMVVTDEKWAVRHCASPAAQPGGPAKQSPRRACHQARQPPEKNHEPVHGHIVTTVCLQQFTSAEWLPIDDSAL